jgi:putative flavoprotein involved in K+ transport
VTQVHSGHYRNPQALPEGPVLVVGGGNSGFQIAEELATTRQVDLSIAAGYPMLPQRLAGRGLFWWLTRLGLMRVTVGSKLGFVNEDAAHLADRIAAHHYAGGPAKVGVARQ